MTGVELIAAERRRQVEAEGWSAEHDQTHSCGELAVAAAELAVHGTDAEVDVRDFDADMWGLVAKHGDDDVRALAIAGALIAAEIDRMLMDAPTSEAEERKTPNPEADTGVPTSTGAGGE